MHRKTGGASRDRTDDLLLARQMLSQLSYDPSTLSRSWITALIHFLSTLHSTPDYASLIRATNMLTCYPFCLFAQNQSLAHHAKLVGLGGLEPPTSPLSGVRSNQLSYRPSRVLYLTVLATLKGARCKYFSILRLPSWVPLQLKAVLVNTRKS